MKKLLTLSVMTMVGFSLMAYAQTINASGCANINGIQVCGSTNGQAGTMTGGGAGAQVITTGAGGQVGQSLVNLIVSAQQIVNLLVPFGIGLAVVALFYGIIMFMFKKDEAEAHKKWLSFIGMSLVGLFVMVSVWGLVRFMGSVVGVGQGGGVDVPALPVTPRVY